MCGPQNICRKQRKSVTQNSAPHLFPLNFTKIKRHPEFDKWQHRIPQKKVCSISLHRSEGHLDLTKWCGETYRLTTHCCTNKQKQPTPTLPQDLTTPILAFIKDHVYSCHSTRKVKFPAFSLCIFVIKLHHLKL